MKLTYKQIVTTSVVPVVQKLVNMSVFDSKTAYRLHKIHEKLREYYLKSMLEFDDLGVKYGQKDDKDQVKKDGKGQHLPLEGKETEYADALNKFLATEFEIPQHPVHIDNLSARFSPAEMAALEPLVTGLE